MYNYSAKSEGFLREVVSLGINASSRATLLNICITHWVENRDGWESFFFVHPFLIKICEVMLYGYNSFPVYIFPLL